MRVSVSIAPGPKATFGPVTVTGLDDLEEAYVHRLVPWRTGEVYDSRKVEELRRRLSDTRLFLGVSVGPAEAPDPDGALPVRVDVTEGKHRSIGAGVNYDTDVGPGVQIYWEHRNLLHKNETLRLSGRGSLLLQEITADFRNPNTGAYAQDFVANAAARRLDGDAYEEQTLSLFAGGERLIRDVWRLRGGGVIDISRIMEHGEIQDITDRTRDVALIGAPLSAVRDTSDDPLNPVAGSRLRLGFTPFTGVSSEGPLTFAVAEFGGSHYFPVLPEDRLVLAGRYKLSTIFGEEVSAIPANKRLYSGGGGSVRGYEFQTVGPLDANGDPTGGRSLLELGLEMRFRVTDTIGVVPFVDGGLVDTGMVPTEFSDLRWAAGLGLRYYTAIGPLRLDVAVPINRRPDVDDAFEFYLSLGQAF